MIFTDKLPRLKISVSKILETAECYKDLLTIESKVKRTGYVFDKDEILIVRPEGILRIHAEDAKILAQELSDVGEMQREWKRR